MPVEPKLVGGKVRTVAAGTKKIEKTPQGNARDGGGWPNTPAGWKKAAGQSTHINEPSPKKPVRKGPFSKPRRSSSPVRGPWKAPPM